MSRELPNIEYIRKQFESEKYFLLSTKCENSTEKLNYICPNQHKYNISWNHWQQGNRCLYCFRKKLYQKLRNNFSTIKKLFENENYKLLVRNYRNNKQKLEYICPEGHKHSITWANWTSGKRCPFCFRKRSAQEKRKNFEEIKASFEKKNIYYYLKHTKMNIKN